MESQWIVELTSSGRVDAVKKGPFPLIIYFPIRQCPARGKNTFISGTLFCEPSRSPSTRASSALERERQREGERAWQIDWPCSLLHVCVCLHMLVSARVWRKKPKTYYLHTAGWSKRLYKSFVLFCPFTAQMHSYGVSLMLYHGSHDSVSVALRLSSQMHTICGHLAVRSWNVWKKKSGKIMSARAQDNCP